MFSLYLPSRISATSVHQSCPKWLR